MQNQIDSKLGYIHRWEPEKSERTILLLHGTGGDENDLIPLGRELASGVNLLSPRGNVVEDGRYNRFFARHAEGVYDDADLILRAGQLAEFVKGASKAYGFDAGNVWAVGFSNGANIAAAVLVLHPYIFKGAVLLSPMKPIQPKATPDLSNKSVFIGTGSYDDIAPKAGIEALAGQLKGYGADVDLKFYPIGHTISAPEVGDAKTWLSRE